MSSIIERARLAATFAHGAKGQVRKYTGTPYIEHPERVAELVGLAGGNDQMIAAAYLHDVVEDTDVSLKMIETEFGYRVAWLIKDMTNVARKSDGDRATRVAMNRAHSARACSAAQTIKLADVIDNLSSIGGRDPEFAAVYFPEKAALLDVLTKGDKGLQEMARRLVDNYFEGI